MRKVIQLLPLLIVFAIELILAYDIWHDHIEIEWQVMGCFILSVVALIFVMINFELGLFIITLFLLLGSIGIIRLTVSDVSFYITNKDATIFRLQGFFLLLFIVHFALNRKVILTKGADLFGYTYNDSTTNK